MLVRDAQRRADSAAATFDSADFVHARTREALLERLDPIVVDSALVVDLGSATGGALRRLSKKFRGARLIAVDVSRNMLHLARKNRGRLSRPWFVQADAACLPFADGSVDVVFSNLLLPWLDEPGVLFSEVSRILRLGGLFAFSALGPDSLLELRRAWRRAGGDTAADPYLDMHDIGDTAVRAGLADPVLDVDRLTITYRDTATAYADLTAMGARGGRPSRRGLVGRNRFAAMQAALEEDRVDGLLRFSLEIVYGHCWGGGTSGGVDEHRIRPAQIRRRRG